MRCINFDKEFERYISVWMKEHAKEYKNYDEMEAAMPDVYEEFLDTPVNWLGGAKPGEYFSQFDNAHQLVNWMEDYFKQRIPAPDMLLNRIAELGLAAEESLMNLLKKEKATQEIKMAAITLLREIESIAPMEYYIGLQAIREEGEDELADNALDSLSSMGKKAVDAMRKALPLASPNGQEAMLTVLCDYPGDENVFQTAMRLFRERRESVAILADCLGLMRRCGACSE